MRVAIVHDWLVTNSGAEKVLRAIVDLYPDSDIFSLVDFLSDEDRNSVLDNRKAKTTFIQNLPFAKKHFRNYLPLFPRAIESLDLRGYDLIISSSWAVAKGIKKTKEQLHICYCHTPIRYAWDLYDEYTAHLGFLKKIFVKATLAYIKKWDIATLEKVDYFVANSSFVKERIQKTYKKDATVIYPPIDLEMFALEEKKEEYYLTASRLVPYKKTKLIVEAFNEFPEKKLIVIGDGEELEEIKRIAKENIQVLGFQSSEFLAQKMKNAKCFIYGALEDFGIVVIESLACGTPVIAFGEGGTKETVIDGVSGVHFPLQTKEEIQKAVVRFESMHFNSQKVNQCAFSFDGFKEKFKNFVEEKIEERD